MQTDYRTYRALEKKKQNLLDGEVVKIGKSLYHINSTYLKTSQDFPVYEVMQDDKQYAYVFFKKYDYEATRTNDHWVLGYRIE